jgi:hypothetical protein
MCNVFGLTVEWNLGLVFGVSSVNKILFLATREMMKIMQEYGEVVVCAGSNLNSDNINLFLQGDCRLDINLSFRQYQPISSRWLQAGSNLVYLSC